MSSWWCTVVDDRGRRFLYELGEDDPTEAEIAEIKAAHNVPADWLERRLDLGESWSVSVSPGEPHPEQFWSRAEIRATRERLETEAGVPARRAHIRQLRQQLQEAKAHLPLSLIEPMLDNINEAERAMPVIGAEEIRAGLADVPPSGATVNRRPRST